jgi:hypothetical protein
VLDRVNANATSFAMLNQINANQASAQEAEEAVKDVYGKLHTGLPDWGMVK